MPEVSEEHLDSMRKANIDFGFDLLRQLATTKNDNLAVSALSIRAAFGMVHAMARGTTQRENATALGFLDDSNATHQTLNHLDLTLDSRSLPANMEKDPVIYATANRMFVRPSLLPGSQLLDTLALHYGAGVFLTDFANDPEDVCNKINLWVSERTRMRIPMLFPAGSISANTQWVLVNALLTCPYLPVHLL